MRAKLVHFVNILVERQFSSRGENFNTPSYCQVRWRDHQILSSLTCGRRRIPKRTAVAGSSAFLNDYTQVSEVQTRSPNSSFEADFNSLHCYLVYPTSMT